MSDLEELFYVMLMWLGFMAVVGWYASRIFFLLREQSINERSYRMHLAVRRGRQVREQAAETQAPQA
ncbi:MAG TPA: hypothetical protein VJY35_00320 [Candidatus Eisenbacteria bacterium]|nr:hypothetical protein [Candidatus Eisenbacteria bacterium]